MSSSDQVNNAIKELLTRLNPSVPSNEQNKSGKCENKAGDTSGIHPSQALIIGALLAGVLEVASVLVDRDQTIEIVLTGSLKKKTDLEKLLDQIGSRPFDEVVKAMLGRL